VMSLFWYDSMGNTLRLKIGGFSLALCCVVVFFYNLLLHECVCVCVVIPFRGSISSFGGPFSFFPPLVLGNGGLLVNTNVGFTFQYVV